jgi:hypothetical protein
VVERRAYGGGEDETVVPPEGTTPLSPMSAQPEIPSSSNLTSRPDPTVWCASCVAFATISMKLLTAGGGPAYRRVYRGRRIRMRSPRAACEKPGERARACEHLEQHERSPIATTTPLVPSGRTRANFSKASSLSDRQDRESCSAWVSEAAAWRRALRCTSLHTAPW